MHYRVQKSSRFKKSFKRVCRFPGFHEDRFDLAVTMLSRGESLPEQFRDHALTGDMAALRECHIAPDILLIYELNDGVLTLTLMNIGKHSQLFR